jgi:hypothetical protein
MEEELGRPVGQNSRKGKVDGKESTEKREGTDSSTSRSYI